MNQMRTETAKTYRVAIYMSGPIEIAKQIIRQDTMREGLCVTIEPTLFIYTGGEECGFVIGLLNYPRFPANWKKIWNRAEALARKLLKATCQHSALLVAPDSTVWITTRKD